MIRIDTYDLSSPAAETQIAVDLAVYLARTTQVPAGPLSDNTRSTAARIASLHRHQMRHAEIIGQCIALVYARPIVDSLWRTTASDTERALLDLDPHLHAEWIRHDGTAHRTLQIGFASEDWHRAPDLDEDDDDSAFLLSDEAAAQLDAMARAAEVNPNPMAFSAETQAELDAEAAAVAASQAEMLAARAADPWSSENAERCRALEQTFAQTDWPARGICNLQGCTGKTCSAAIGVICPVDVATIARAMGQTT